MKPLLALILFSLSFSSFAARISLYDEPLTQFSSWVSQQTGKTIIVSSDLHSFLVNVDGDYSGHEELLSLYRAILQANELQMQFQEGFYRVTKRVAKPPVHVDDSIKLKVYKLLNVRPEDLHENIKPFIQASVSVSVMPSSSSIAFYGPEPHVDALIEFSQLFDVKPKQVLIEAVLMETNVTNAESVGVFIRSQLSQSGFSASSNTAIGDVNFESKGGILSYLTGGDIRLFINMIRNNDDVTILSEPRLVSLDRQQAYMTVGQNVPFITGTQSTDGGGVVQSIERKDVGLTVRVKPELVGTDVRLTIFQEISNVTNSTQASDIITSQRAVTTVARVKSGDSLVIGGLVSEESQALENRVPVLGSMPVVGRAFRSNSDSVVTRELQLLIKATII